LFGGGYSTKASPYYKDTVDVFDASLTKSTAAVLSSGRMDLAATKVGDYALFGGGQPTSSVVDAYNSSLTKVTVPALSVARFQLAATTLGAYALFGGGTDDEKYNTVDAYDTSLTRTTPSPLSVTKASPAATTVGSYALFAGGNGKYSTSYYTNTVDAYAIA
jgi:hypothetical protein